MHWDKLTKWYNIVLIILGILFLVSIIRKIWHNIKVNSISNWPKISARVLKVGLQVKTAGLATTDISIGATNQIDYSERSVLLPASIYHPHVVYEYNLDGQIHVSNSFSYGEVEYYGGAQIVNMLRNLAPGTNINVYYNPKDPAETYIYPGTKSYGSLVIQLIILLIIVGALARQVQTGAEYHKSFGTTTQERVPISKFTFSPIVDIGMEGGDFTD